MTLTCSAGAIEHDERGEFRELRTMGVMLQRISPTALRLKTTAGTILELTSSAPIFVTAQEPEMENEE